MPKPAARPVTDLSKLLLSYIEWYCRSPSAISGSSRGKPVQNGIRINGLYIARIPAERPSQNAVHLAHNPDIPQGSSIHREGILWQEAESIGSIASSLLPETGQAIENRNIRPAGTPRRMASTSLPRRKLLIMRFLRRILSGFFYPDDPCLVIRFYLSELSDICSNCLHKSNVCRHHLMLKHYIVTYVALSKIT